MPSAALPPAKRVDVPLVEEASELEELEQFAKAFKQRRIKLGFTQVPQVLLACDGLTMLSNFIITSKFSVRLTTRETLAWPWESCTGMTSARPPSLALRPWTWASRTCASSNLCWRSGSMMLVRLTSLSLTFGFKSFNKPFSICCFLISYSLQAYPWA